MKKIILTEKQFSTIIKNITNINNDTLDEGIFDGIQNAYRGLKGIKRGFGYDYFKNISRLEKLILRLKKLDEPNAQVMVELEDLKKKVGSLNLPQTRKDAIVNLIDNSTFHFKKYNDMNDRILSKIKTVNLDSWS